MPGEHAGVGRQAMPVDPNAAEVVDAVGLQDSRRDTVYGIELGAIPPIDIVNPYTLLDALRRVQRRDSTCCEEISTNIAGDACGQPFGHRRAGHRWAGA